MMGSRRSRFIKQAERAQTGAHREGARVAHEDARRRRVPPQKAETRPDERDRDETEVERRV